MMRVNDKMQILFNKKSKKWYLKTVEVLDKHKKDEKLTYIFYSFEELLIKLKFEKKIGNITEEEFNDFLEKVTIVKTKTNLADKVKKSALTGRTCVVDEE